MDRETHAKAFEKHPLWQSSVSSSGAVAERVTLRPPSQGHPTSRWSGLPEDTRTLPAAWQRSCRRGSNFGGPGRGLVLAPPQRGPAGSPPVTWIPQCQEGAEGSAAGVLSLERANKGFLTGKTPNPGIGAQSSLFKASGRHRVIIYPRLSTHTCLSHLDLQMFTLFPPKPNAGLFINPRGFGRLSMRQIRVEKEASKH